MAPAPGPGWLSFNFVAFPLLLVAVVAFCVRSLASGAVAAEVAAAPSAAPRAGLALAAVHAGAALGAATLLREVYLDTTPLTVNYRVMGRSDIPEVVATFRHIGRWTTFTLWCNTVGALYFGAAALVDASLLLTGSVPEGLASARCALWEVTLPMAFLVNIVVTWVLIPACKKGGRLDKLAILMRFRPQCLHNGFVLATAAEAALASPPMRAANFPAVTLFGVAYVVFALGLWMRRGIFHYFFLDPRFSFSTLSVVALLALLTALHRLGCVAVAAASTSALAGAGVVLAALSTCTFRDKALDGLKPVAGQDRASGG